MQRDPETAGEAADGPPPQDSNADTMAANEPDASISPQTSAAARPSLAHITIAALGTAFLGSVLLGVAEHLLGSTLSSVSKYEHSWPWDLVLAATGRIIATHLTVWIPALIVSGILYRLVAGRGRRAAPEPFLLGFFVALATLVVVPADLELAHRKDPVYLIVGLALGLGFALGVYYLARGILDRIGRRRFRSLFYCIAALAVGFALVTGLLFTRSPLLNPGSYTVPAGGPPPPSAKDRNVLWIVLDTTRADRLSVYDRDTATTPFLAKWAEDSLVFERVIANGTWTLPTHASMFTGLAARTHGLGHAVYELDESFQTVAEVLGANGYLTALFSNNVLVGPKTNLAKGFKTSRVVRDFHHAARCGLEFLWEKSGLPPVLPWLDVDEGAALTNLLIARWLDEHSSGPCFVFINYMEAHLPYRCPSRYRGMFMTDRQVRRSYAMRRRAYGDLREWLNMHAAVEGYENMPEFDRTVVKRQYESALRYLDDRVCEVLELFRQRGLLDNTLVVITADHGEYLDTHGMWSHHFLAYQDVIHVPLLLWKPDLQSPQRLGTCAQLSDLYPTVLSSALGKRFAETGGDTCDLFTVAKEDGNQRIAISEFFGAEPEVRPRLLAASDPLVRHRAAAQVVAVDGRFKYIRSADGMRELYDLSSDPTELNNLEYERWKDVERLDKYVESWLKAVPSYQTEEGHRATPDRDTLELLKALGYVADDE